MGLYDSVLGGRFESTKKLLGHEVIDWEGRARELLGCEKHRTTDPPTIIERYVTSVAAALAQAYGEGLGDGRAEVEKKR